MGFGVGDVSVVGHKKGGTVLERGCFSTAGVRAPGDGVRTQEAGEGLIVKGLTETQRCCPLSGTAPTDPDDQFRDVRKWGLKKRLGTYN